MTPTTLARHDDGNGEEGAHGRRLANPLRGGDRSGGTGFRCWANPGPRSRSPRSKRTCCTRSTGSPITANGFEEPRIAIHEEEGRVLVGNGRSRSASTPRRTPAPAGPNARWPARSPGGRRRRRRCAPWRPLFPFSKDRHDFPVDGDGAAEGRRTSAFFAADRARSFAKCSHSAFFKDAAASQRTSRSFCLRLDEPLGRFGQGASNRRRSAVSWLPSLAVPLPAGPAGGNRIAARYPRRCRQSSRGASPSRPRRREARTSGGTDFLHHDGETFSPSFQSGAPCAISVKP